MAKLLILSQNTVHSQSLLMDMAGRLTWQMYEHPDIIIKPYYGSLDRGKPIPVHFWGYQKGEIGEAYGSIIYGGEDFIPLGPGGPFILGDFSKENDPRADRFIHILEYCVNKYEFDYMYRTGTGYYTDIAKLYKYLELLPDEKVYTGSVFCNKTESPWGDVFVAGANCIMSRDVAEKLVEHKDLYLKISEKAPEDAAMGMVLHDELGYVSPCNQMPEHQLQIFYHLTDKKDIKLSDKPYLFNYKFFPGQYREFMKLHYQVVERDD